MPPADLEQLEWFRFRKRRAKAIIVIGLVIGFGITSWTAGIVAVDFLAATSGCTNRGCDPGYYFLIACVSAFVSAALVIAGTVSFVRARRDLAELISR